MNNSNRKTFEDPLSLFSRLATRLHTLWLSWTYPFVSLGSDVRVHYTCDMRRCIASHIRIGNSVWIDRDVWLNIPVLPDGPEPVILLDEACKIGRRTMISAKNRIQIERNAIFGPSVLVMDHNHAFEDIDTPIIDQGITEGGTIRIGEGCWIGSGAAIVCGKGELVIGKHSVIGANSLVTRSVPPYSVVTGNPAKIVKQYDPSKGEWVLGSAKVTVQS